MTSQEIVDPPAQGPSDDCIHRFVDGSCDDCGLTFDPPTVKDLSKWAGEYRGRRS